MSRPALLYQGVVACALDGGIGIGGQMPWHLPADLARFRRQTMGTPMLMGRRTWEQIGKPLPGRLSLVLSRKPAPAVAVAFGEERVRFVTSLEEAEAAAHGWWASREARPPDSCSTGFDANREAAPSTSGVADARLFSIVGGQQIYRLCASRIARWHLTLVHTQGLTYDTWLDALPQGAFAVVGRTEHPADEKNRYAQTELWLERRGAGSTDTVPWTQWLTVPDGEIGSRGVQDSEPADEEKRDDEP